MNICHETFISIYKLRECNQDKKVIKKSQLKIKRNKHLDINNIINIRNIIVMWWHQKTYPIMKFKHSQGGPLIKCSISHKRFYSCSSIICAFLQPATGRASSNFLF